MKKSDMEWSLQVKQLTNMRKNQVRYSLSPVWRGGMQIIDLAPWEVVDWIQRPVKALAYPAELLDFSKFSSEVRLACREPYFEADDGVVYQADFMDVDAPFQARPAETLPLQNVSLILSCRDLVTVYSLTAEMLCAMGYEPHLPYWHTAEGLLFSRAFRAAQDSFYADWTMKWGNKYLNSAIAVLYCTVFSVGKRSGINYPGKASYNE